MRTTTSLLSLGSNPFPFCSPLYLTSSPSFLILVKGGSRVRRRKRRGCEFEAGSRCLSFGKWSFRSFGYIKGSNKEMSGFIKRKDHIRWPVLDSFIADNWRTAFGGRSVCSSSIEHCKRLSPQLMAFFSDRSLSYSTKWLTILLLQKNFFQITNRFWSKDWKCLRLFFMGNNTLWMV